MITDLQIGGVPLHLQRLVRGMRARGVQSTVVSLATEGPVGAMLRAEGVEVHACNGQSGIDYRVLGRLRKLMEVTRPDLIHSLLFHANVAARFAARRSSFPSHRVLCEIQTVEKDRRWHLLVDRLTHRGCRLTIGNSQSVIEHLTTHARIPRERLRLVHGGIDPVPFRDARPSNRSTLNLANSDRVVIWVGRLDPVKGLSVLLEAFSALKSQIDVQLLLVGDGPLRASLAAEIEWRNLTNCVQLLGARRDIPALLKAADVFAFPSRTEGFPNALLEAMAAGLPIVTTDVPGCRDLIANDLTGLLVPYGDAAALSNALRRLVSDRTYASALASRASDEVTRNWHFEKTLDTYFALYQEAVAGT